MRFQHSHAGVALAGLAAVGCAPPNLLDSGTAAHLQRYSAQQGWIAQQ